jgi:hypothetical protein
MLAKHRKSDTLELQQTFKQTKIQTIKQANKQNDEHMKTDTHTHAITQYVGQAPQLRHTRSARRSAAPW